MAARLNKRQCDSARALIQTNRHIEELQKHVFGDREMSMTQVRSAQFLIEQSIGKAPQSVEMDMDGNVQLTWKS